MEKIILHSDLNNFYASVECLDNPKIANLPVAVSGGEKNRKGVVLAKNMLAKKCGVKTGDTIYEARKKCSEIIFVEPRFDRYIEVSNLVKQVYYEYTNLIEPFGVDECWLDVGDSIKLFGSGENIASLIRKRVKEEIGITVSIGVSFNKVFAKLGSDMKKPDAITIIDKNNFREKVWPLPISELLYAGKATVKKLNRMNVFSIGDLAKANSYNIQKVLGKNGLMLQKYALGLDDEMVKDIDFKREVKSVGNGTTLPFDLTKIDDVKIVLMLLSESVSKRLREKGVYCENVGVEIKYSNFEVESKILKMENPSNCVDDIYSMAFKIFEKQWNYKPIRALSVRGGKICCKKSVQESIFEAEKKSLCSEKIDCMNEQIREKFGFNSIQRGIMLLNKDISKMDLTDQNTLQSIAFYKG